MSTHCDHLKSAQHHLRAAAKAAAEHVVPKDIRDHLRQAARETLLAGAAALDRTEPVSAPAAAEPAVAPATI
jgi:hypothetical protein